MATQTQEILNQALKDVSALACSDEPDITAIKAGLLRCIVAADCVDLDNAMIVDALTTHARNEVRDFSDRLARSTGRITHLLQERETIKALLFSIHTNASEALRENIQAIPLPEYEATAQVRYLSDILRAIGVAAKNIYDSYTIADGGTVQESNGQAC